MSTPPNPDATRGGRPSRQLQRRLVRLTRRQGDYCYGCRRADRHHELAFTGYSERRRLIMVGECCVSRLTELVAASVYHAADPPSPWSEDDRDWLERHPGRSHRLRRAYAGEWPQRGISHIAVCQLELGVRRRVGITIPEELPQVDEAPEGAASAIFDLATGGRQDGRGEITVAEVCAHWAALENGGRA
ncbi:MAG: hypothetical protein J2P48_14650 [Alphaproteobacteria bacterium]|nr:hypothetical protein [Alphaproteobacteria bacterium]